MKNYQIWLEIYLFRLTINFKFNYNFLIDNNYNDLNYSDLGINFSNDLIKFDINYLKENKHIGNKEYIKTNLIMIIVINLLSRLRQKEILLQIPQNIMI